MKDKFLGGFNYIAAAFAGFMTMVLTACPAFKLDVYSGANSADCIELLSLDNIYGETAGALASGTFNVFLLIMGMILFIIGVAGFLASIDRLIFKNDFFKGKLMNQIICVSLSVYTGLALISLICLGAFIGQMNDAIGADVLKIGGAVICMFVFGAISCAAAWAMTLTVNKTRFAAEETDAEEQISEDTSAAPQTAEDTDFIEAETEFSDAEVEETPPADSI